ncbi:DUF1016 N-terminal domain-containing protein [Asticcacaulis taihuensis]|uniref:DUF1016 N-terminal domain-containing protein n=1 Tax=Asticcacaulis taihuensis TaxID=260084 RepID=UPI0034E933D2
MNKINRTIGRLPWGHVIRLVEGIKSDEQRQWYAHQAIENGWTRHVLIHQIESNLFGQFAGASERHMTLAVKRPYRFS